MLAPEQHLHDLGIAGQAADVGGQDVVCGHAASLGDHGCGGGPNSSVHA
jgi:hypothetical protein